jgi:hypothetical protein
MDSALIDQAIELLDKANADLEPELLPAPVAHRLLASYARAEKLAGFGVAALARKVDDASHVARITGVSAGTARGRGSRPARRCSTPTISAPRCNKAMSL